MRTEQKHRKTKQGRQEKIFTEAQKKFNLLKDEVLDTTAEEAPPLQESRPKVVERGKST